MNGNLRILMIAPFFLPHIGGVEKHIEKISAELIKRGHEVNVLTFKHAQGLPSFENYNQVKIYRLPAFNRRFHGFSPEIWRWLFRNRSLIANSDLIHCHDFYTFFYWYLPFRFLFPSKKVFITFHGWEGAFPIPKKMIIRRKITEFLTQGNICVGDYITRWYGTRCDFIIYGGVDVPAASPPVARPDLSAIFIGRLEKDTSILEIVKAVEILKREFGIEVKLEVCGDGSLRREVEEFVKNANLSVDMRGFVRDPTRNLPANRFSFVTGYLGILESMVNRRLVFSVYNNQIKKDILVSIPNSSETMIIQSSSRKLAESVKDIIEHPEEELRMVDKAEVFARMQTWSQVTDVYFKLWRKYHRSLN
jgi:glycosyltransferase involved in cell wall biosynthesis